MTEFSESTLKTIEKMKEALARPGRPSGAVTLSIRRPDGTVEEIKKESSSIEESIKRLQEGFYENNRNSCDEK